MLCRWSNFRRRYILFRRRHNIKGSLQTILCADQDNDMRKMCAEHQQLLHHHASLPVPPFLDYVSSSVFVSPLAWLKGRCICSPNVCLVSCAYACCGCLCSLPEAVNTSGAPFTGNTYSGHHSNIGNKVIQATHFGQVQEMQH
jgi:hypothetical protein